MSGVGAPPELFAMTALTAGQNDPDLQPGSHVRLLPSPALGFPVAPFKVVPLEARRIQLEPDEVRWSDGAGATLPFGAVAPGEVLIGDVLSVPQAAIDLALEVVADGEVTVTLLDRRGDRMLATRNHPPLIVAGPRPDRVRIEGQASEISLWVHRIWPERLRSSLTAKGHMLQLPVDGDVPPWYLGTQGDGDPQSRVLRGAPRRLWLPDQPDGSTVLVEPENELARVMTSAPALLDQCRQMLADPAVYPAAATFSGEVPAGTTVAGVPTPRQAVSFRRAASLLARAMDPGIGRFLGLMDRFEDLAPEGMLVYAAIGIFAIPPDATFGDDRLLLDAIGQAHPLVEGVGNALVTELGIGDAIHRLEDAGAAVRGLIAFCAVPPPPDPPVMPPPDPRKSRSRWRPAAAEPSDAFDHELVIPGVPLGALVALAREQDGEWVSQHRMATLDPPPPLGPPERAEPVLLGRTRERPPQIPDGLIGLGPVPAGGASLFRLALADLFGRFGPPTDATVPEPRRPGPPTPAPQVDLTLDGPEGEAIGPASPGHAVVKVPIPSVTVCAPGALDIATMSLWRDGVHVITSPVGVPQAGETGTASANVVLPDLLVGASARSLLRVELTDTDGRTSPAGEVTVAYADRRRPPFVETALGIIWTSRPGAAEEVELALQWPRVADVRYRVYAADALTLGLSGATRALVAAEGGSLARQHRLGRREQFRLLTVDPLVPEGSLVNFVATFPRSLASVQFLRIVPVTDVGREAEFDRCPVIAVAVPSDRRPPAPQLSAEVASGAARAHLALEATGLDLVALESAEPGLFTGSGGVAPGYRLRRAVGPVTEPRYAREIHRGALSVANGVAFAKWDDPEQLEPFVRYTYWLEVRMPPERRLPAGVPEEPSGTGAKPREPFQLRDIPGLFSEPSAPSSVIAAPSGPPAALASASASIGSEPGGVYAKLRVPAPPAAHLRAVAPYRLRIWEQWGGGDIAHGADVDTTVAPLVWTGAARPGPLALPLTLHVAVIDPLGREGPISTFSATSLGLTIPFTGGWAYDLSFSPDGSALAVACRSDSRIVDPASGADITALVDVEGLDQVAFSPDGTWIAGAAATALVRLDAASGATVWRAPHGETVMQMALAPDGGRVVSATDSAARILDAQTGAELASVPSADPAFDPVREVAIAPFGGRLAVGGGTNNGASNTGSLRMADLLTGTVLWKLDFGAWVTSLAFDPSGTRLAAGFSDASVIVVDVATGAKIADVRPGQASMDNQIEAVAFSPDGSRIALAGRDGFARIHGTTAGAQAVAVEHAGAIWALSWSPDGTMVATAADAGSRVFDAGTGATVTGLGDGVHSVRFSPDGQSVATGGFMWVQVMPLPAP